MISKMLDGGPATFDDLESPQGRLLMISKVGHRPQVQLSVGG